MADFDWTKHEAELAEACRLSEEKSKEMVLKHPVLFRGKVPQFGLCTHEGWLALQDKLFSGIEAILVAENIPAEIRGTKEKFGVLRISLMVCGRSLHSYRQVEGRDDLRRILDLVSQAQLSSGFTCIYCGAQCEVKSHGGYMAPICDAHGGADGTPMPKLAYAELKEMIGFKRTVLAHPSRGLVWSNPDVSDEVLVRRALASASPDLIKEAILDFGLPYVAARWDEIKDDLDLPRALFRLSDMASVSKAELLSRHRQRIEKILAGASHE